MNETQAHRTEPTTYAPQLVAAAPAALEISADLLVAEIEQYLAAHPAAPRTAHPLITKTTEQLVAEALGTPAASTLATVPAPAAPPAGIRLPGGLWRMLPDWALTALRPLQGGTGVARLRITPAEHLDLTALVLERWGWDQTPGHWRTPTGRRCILGAQAVLFRLGYGTEHTVAAAGAHLDNVLRSRGIRATYWDWNDSQTVTRDQVLTLVREGAAAAREAQ